MKTTLSTCLILIGLATAAPAQTSDSETLQALLAEVRQLRAAIEVYGAAVPKAHITVQKLQLQQQRVAKLSDQMSEVRTQIDQTLRQKSAMANHLEQKQKELRIEQDPMRRLSIENESKAIKGAIEAGAAAEQQFRVREAELNSALNSEQAKLGELELALDRLEKTLAAVGGRN